MLTRQELENKLVRVTMLRSLITLGSILPTLLIASALPVAQNQWIAPVCFFGTPMLVDWIVTKTLCRRMIRCPACSGSLWESGNGAFKPRKVKLRRDVRRVSTLRDRVRNSKLTLSSPVAIQPVLAGNTTNTGRLVARHRCVASANRRSVGDGDRKLLTESSVVSREDSHREKNLPATRTAGYRDGMKQFKFTLRDLFWLVLVCGLVLGWWLDRRNFHYSENILLQMVTEAKMEANAARDELARMRGN
jgi:hypothetical protein